METQPQDYGPPKLTLGIIGIIALIIPILLGYFLVTGMASNPNYNFGPTGTSTISTTASGGGGATISIPSGAGNPSGAPGYAPDDAVVYIGQNASVTWVNNDSVPHTVTSLNVTGGSPVFDSGNMNAGATFTFNFTQPGTYDYKCNYHSWMTGTIVVKQGVTAVSVSIPSGAGSGPQAAPGYAPDKITVVIGVNNTVTWSNDDTAPHTVTSLNMTGGSPVFDSGNMNSGATFTFTFTQPGTYDYKCNYHSWMTGTVVVEPGA